MKTYVMLNEELRFSTIEEAIEEAEKLHLETACIDVYVEDGTHLEGQIAERNPYSGDLVYSTWGVFQATFTEDDRLESTDIIAEQINSEDEAREIALNVNKNYIYIQAYTQTLSENLDNIGEPEFIEK